MNTRERMIAEGIRRAGDIREAAKDALMVQDASNLSGVVRTLANYMPAVLRDARSGTQEANHHPVVQLFVGKLIELCGMGFADSEAYNRAYVACEEMVARREEG